MSKVGFLFPGQGAQFVGMGKSVYEASSQAKALFDNANQVLGYDLATICFEGPEEELRRTEIAQPAIYVTSLAVLAALKETLPDLSPEVGLGLSLGEYTALAALEATSFEEGLRLVKLRAEAMEKATKLEVGTMASVLGSTVADCESACSEVAGVGVANINSPEQIVISGTPEGVSKASDLLKEKGARKVIPLKVSGAFHSELMQPAVEELKEAVLNATIQTPTAIFIPNFLATPIKEVAEIKDYLLKQLTGTVRWSDSFLYATQQGISSFLEIGPGSVLKGLARKTEKSAEVTSIETFDQVQALVEKVN